MIRDELFKVTGDLMKDVFAKQRQEKKGRILVDITTNQS